MTHGSLFSGIGGFDLAAEWMGWENKFHCEWNPFGQKVLHHYWPEAEQFTDITKSDFTKYANRISVLTGGFPCQPYSSAGKRLGKEDERHLWPEMLRAIREIYPRWVVGENVRGLTNWNEGMVFDEVQADLEAIGYEVTPFLLPACAVNAPHRRDRIWFIAYSKSCTNSRNSGTISSSSNKENEGREEPSSASKQQIQLPIESSSLFGDATDSEFVRLEHSTDKRKISGTKRYAKREWSKSSIFIKTNDNGYKSNWNNFPTVSPICVRDDGFSNRLDGITFSKWRNESIKAAGNAIVPQVALQIFKAIEQYERL